MSKYDLIQNIKKKNSQTTKSNTADSSTQKTTKVTTKTVTTQPVVNKQKARLQSYSAKVKSADQNKKTTRYDDYTNVAKTDNKYSQASAGVKAMAEGRDVETAIRDYTKNNLKQVEQERADALKKAAKAQEQVNYNRKYIDSNKALKAVSDTGLKVLGGTTNSVGGMFKAGSNIAQGIGGITGNQELVSKAQQFDSDLGLDAAARNVNKNNMVANNMVGNIAESIGGMIPTIGATLLSGGSNALGLGTMGTSVFGNSGSEAFKNLSADGDLSAQDAYRALTYGGASAGLEVGTEALSSLFPGLDTFAFTNPSNLFGQAGGEALEEMVSSALDPLVKPLADPNVQNGTDYGQSVIDSTAGDLKNYIGDIAYSGLLGGLTSVVMGIPARVAGLKSANAQERVDNYNRIHEALAQLEEASQMAQTNEQRVEIERVLTGIENWVADNTKKFNTEEAQKLLSEIQTKQTEFGVAREISDIVENNDPGLVEPKGLAEQNTLDLAEPNEAVVTETPVAETTETPQATVDDMEYITDLTDRIKVDPTSEEAKTGVSEAIRSATGDNSEATARVTESILDEINKEHEVLTKIPLNETEPGQIKESKTKQTEIKRLKIDGDEMAAERLKNDPNRGNYTTISRESAMKSANKIFKESGLDGLMQLIDNRTMLENKGTSGILLDYALEYQKQSPKIKDKFMKDNNLSFDTDGDLVQNGVKVAEDSELAKQCRKMDEDTDKVADLIEAYGSNAGYAMRVMRLVQELSPKYQLNKIEKRINKMNAEMHKYESGRSKGSISALTEAEKKAFLSATTEEAKADALKAIEERIASEVPTGMSEALSSWRYLMMLMNPTTHIRNLVGNGLMQGIVSAKNAIKWGVERAFFQSRRFVSHIDTNNASDMSLKYYASTKPFSALNTMHDEYMKAGLNNASRAKRKAFWESKGFTGKTLDYLVKGKDAVISGTIKERWGNSLANVLKDGGYQINEKGALVDSKGTEVKQADFIKLMEQGYVDSTKKYVGSSEFTRTNEQGKAVYATRATDPDLFAFADKHFKKVSENSRDAGKWNANGTTAQSKVFEKTGSELFNNTVGKGIDKTIKFNSDLLDKEDRVFTNFRFSSEFVTQLKKNGYTVKDGVLMKNGVEADMDSKEMIQMENYAYEEALESVFRDVNEWAKWITSGRNKNAAAKVAIDAIMPFTTTPLNISRRVVEYSPLGLGRGLFNALHSVRAGTVSAQDAVNRIARGTTGTGLLLLGAMLASWGLLKGKDEDESRADRYETSLGIGKEYAFQFDDGSSYTLDWAAPAGAILLLGATLHDNLEGIRLNEGDDLTHNAQTVLDWMFESAMTTFDPVIDMTVFSGLQDVLEEYENDEIAGIAKGILSNYVGQFTPTIGGKINKIIDDTKRTSYSDTWIDKQVRRNMNKIPLMSALLEPALDYKGEEISNKVVNTGNEAVDLLGNTAYYMLSPGTYTPRTDTDYDTELVSLSRETGKKYIVPTQFSFLEDESGKRFQFTPEERTELNKYYAQTYQDEFKKFMDSDSYAQYGDDKEGKLAKAEIIDKIQRHVYNMTVEKYFSKVTPEAGSTLWDADKAAEFMKNDLGMDYYQYYEMKAIEPEKDKEGNTISQSAAMKTRSYMLNQGIYEQVVKAINAGKLEPNDVGLTKTVIKWDDATFEEKMSALQDKLANKMYGLSDDDDSDKSASGGTGGKSGSASYSRRSSGSSSSSSGVDPVKVTLEAMQNAISKALTAGKKNTASIETEINDSSDSAQALYNKLMGQHTANLNKAKQYTKA